MRMEFPVITQEELKEKLDHGDRFTLLDIRPVSFFWQGHIRKAVNIPADRINDFADERLDQTNPMIVYGQDDQDASLLRAAEDLARRGFHDISVLTTGFVNWRTAGYITESGD